VGEQRSQQVWFLPYPDGPARQITRDLSIYSGLSATIDGRKLVARQTTVRSSLWIVGDDPRDVRPVTAGRAADVGGAGLAWTSDNQLVYDALIGGASRLFIMDAAAGQSRQLTFSEGVTHGNPIVSPDGRLVVFSRFPRGIGCVAVDGSNEHLLFKSEQSVGLPFVSPDSRFVLFVEDGQVWRLPVNGGSREPLTGLRAHPLPPGFAPLALSPDGAWFIGRSTEQGRRRMDIVSVDGSRPWRTLANVPDAPMAAWRPDGRAVALGGFFDSSDVLLAPVDGGRVRQLTNFADQRVLSFAWSPDGRHLAVARGEGFSDLVLITDTGNK